MKIKDILQRDPSTHPLVNQGQARISDKANERVLVELRGELATFVCEGQYADGIQRILSAYLSNLTQTSQKAAWVSGFFGSGKSHLVEVWRQRSKAQKVGAANISSELAPGLLTTNALAIEDAGAGPAWIREFGSSCGTTTLCR